MTLFYVWEFLFTGVLLQFHPVRLLWQYLQQTENNMVVVIHDVLNASGATEVKIKLRWLCFFVLWKCISVKKLHAKNNVKHYMLKKCLIVWVFNIVPVCVYTCVLPHSKRPCFPQGDDGVEGDKDRLRDQWQSQLPQGWTHIPEGHHDR